MLRVSRAVFAVLFFTLVACLRAAPLVALAPASLHQEDKVFGSRVTEAPPLAELVQIALQSDPAAPVHDFVERVAIETLLSEQRLSFADNASAVRAGRLLHADWLLRLRLRAEDPARPRIEADVVDTLRADLLARAESPLTTPPGERDILQPGEEATKIATATASRALAAARARAAIIATRTVVAPLVFINKTGTDRLAPLAASLAAALGADHPASHALGYFEPETAFAESALFLAGLTDLDSGAWAGVADAYLWGEFAEDESYAGPVFGTPVSLTLHLWRQGEEAETLRFTGVLGSLDDLALRAAQGALSAAAGARLAATASARHAAAARLVAVAEPLIEQQKVRFSGEEETARARRTREARCVRLLGLASFFDPEDVPLRERHITLRRRFATTPDDRARWTDEFWRHLDRHLFLPSGEPDLALIVRALVWPSDFDYARPGFGARTLRLATTLKSRPPDESVVRELWRKFIGAAYRFPEEADLRPALESLWPLIRRVHPDLADFTVRADMNERQTIARIYRSDPQRLRALLTDHLFPLDLTPLPVARPEAPRAKLPGTSPASPSTTAPPPPVATPSDPFTAFLREAPASVLGRTRSGPLADPPELSASLLTISLWPSPQASPSSGAFSPLPGQAFFGDVATDGRHLWIGLTASAGDSVAWRARHLARLHLASHSLDWPPGLADVPAPISAFWLENPNEIWAAIRGEGLRVVDHDSPAPVVLKVADGLPYDEIFQLRRGHDAVFLAGSGEKDRDPATIAVSAVGLRDHRIVQRSADAGPELAELSAAARAAIRSFPDDSTQRVVLPDSPVFGFSVTGASSAPLRWESLPAPVQTHNSPFRLRVSLPAPGLPADPDKPRFAHLTGPRDGYWVASARTVIWASGTRRRPLVHWLQAMIGSLADDGRHLFIRATTLDTSGNLNYDETRLFVYDYVDGRWLGWLPLPAGGFLAAGGERLLIARSPHLPLTVLDTSALSVSDPSGRLPAPAPASLPRPAFDRATREQAEAKRRRRSAIFHILDNPPADLDRLATEIASGVDPFSTENGASSLILLSLGKKDLPAVELFLRHARPAAFDAVVNNRPLGLALLHGLLEARRPDLARKILDAGFIPTRDRLNQLSPLGWLAVRSGDVDLVARLHGFGFPLGTSLDEHALREAVAQKNLPLLKFLLEHPRADGLRRDPDDPTGNGLTPLFAAADLGWTDGVRVLLAAGARNFCGDHATGRSLGEAAAPWPEIAPLIRNAQTESDGNLAR